MMMIKNFYYQLFRHSAENAWHHTKSLVGCVVDYFNRYVKIFRQFDFLLFSLIQFSLLL